MGFSESTDLPQTTATSTESGTVILYILKHAKHHKSSDIYVLLCVNVFIAFFTITAHNSMSVIKDAFKPDHTNQDDMTNHEQTWNVQNPLGPSTYCILLKRRGGFGNLLYVLYQRL